MPKRSFTIGSGISSETRFLATSDSLSEDDVASVYANMRAQPDVLNQAWGTKANLIVALRKRYEVLKDQAPPTEATKERSGFFADRKTEAGYLRVAIWHIDSVERRIQEGRIWEAVSLSYDLGELITELAIKMDWEKAALEGQALIEGRKQASRQNRRHQPEDRYEVVKRLIDQGMSTTRAFVEAAKELGDAGPSSARSDYYSVRKNRSNADGMEQ